MSIFVLFGSVEVLFDGVFSLQGSLTEKKTPTSSKLDSCCSSCAFWLLVVLNSLGNDEITDVLANTSTELKKLLLHDHSQLLPN